MTRPLFSFFALSLCAALACQASLRAADPAPPAEAPLVAVGLAKVEITPDEPIRLSGYGNRTEPTSVVGQKLWAKALAIGGDDEQPVVLITADLVGVPAALTEELARRLEKNSRVTRTRLVVCATHTHTGPVVKGTIPFIFQEPVPAAHEAAIARYYDHLVERMERVALDALAARRPGRLAWGEGQATFARNRRKVVDGRWVGFGEVADGAVDHSLPLLRVSDADGKILGLWVNYACHCTTLGGEHNFLHGDWAGTTQELLEAEHPGAIALVSIGCGADANPFPRGEPAHVDQHARQIVAEVDRLLTTPLRPLAGPPQSRWEQIELPLADPPARSAWKAFAEGRKSRPALFAKHILETLDRGEKLPTSIPYPIQTWTFDDDLAMVFLAGEVVADYSLRLKRETAPDRLWVTAYANDLPCYIASRRVSLEGGYEVEIDGSMAGYGRPAPLALGSENKIVAAVKQQLPAPFLRETAPAVEKTSARTRPNLLLIYSDDHSQQAIGAYGSPLARTPALDRLAREGMRFRQSFVTNSICAPARAVVLTGKHSHLNGQVSNYVTFDGAQTTFPKLLQQAGYETALIGKWHLQSEPSGFDHYQILLGQGAYYNPQMDTPHGRVACTGYASDLIADQSIAWLDSRTDDRPFLLMCQHKAPHGDWKPRLDHTNLYDDAEIPAPANLFDDYAGRSSAPRRQVMEIGRDLPPELLHLSLRPEDELKFSPAELAAWNQAYAAKNAELAQANLTGRDLVRWKHRRFMQDYLSTIASLDDSIGRLLDYLDRTGLAENTVVIYASDQGYFLGEHGWLDKRWMYEEALRTPLIVRWPGQTPPGGVNDALVQNLDYAPTLLEIAGVEAPSDMQGRSLVPLLRGETPADWRTSIYYHYYENPGWGNVPRHCGVRTARHKLIHFYQLGEWEFYDLKSDPHEMNNRYHDPAFAETVLKLKGELMRLQEQYRVTDEADRIHDRVAATSPEAQAALEQAKRKHAAAPAP